MTGIQECASVSISARKFNPKTYDLSIRRNFKKTTQFDTNLEISGEFFPLLFFKDAITKALLPLFK
jgi:hypothetical protein